MADVAPSPVRLERLDGGSFWRATLAGGRGNVLDRRTVDALAEVVSAARAAPGLKAVVLEGDGGHFSYGASVPEHLPGEVEGMLGRFHALFRALFDSHVVWLAAVRGRCLGGGLELASFCHRIFAHPGASLGQPEVSLGVFAPVGSVLLVERVGRAAADDLCLTGRTVGGEEALRLGLVDELADDPAGAALAWARAHLAPKSASSLRHAVRAARLSLERRFSADVAELERLYLRDLMGTADAVEGLEAFLEKRPPAWRDR